MGRKNFLRVFGWIAAALVAGGCWTPSEDNGSFRIVSYNIHHGEGMDGVLDFGRIGRIISAERPRFAGIQEVDQLTGRVKGADTCALLEKSTGLHATFAKAIDFDGGAYGNAVLSREVPRDVRRIPLPGAEPRVLLLCEFDDCWFGTMHLAVDSEAARLGSIEAVRRAVADCGGKPVFLSGDWNAWPDSPVLKGLKGFLTVLSSESEATFHGGRASAAEGPNRNKCIDYIVLDSAHCGEYAVCGRRVVQERLASDHYPIAVTVGRSAPSAAETVVYDARTPQSAVTATGNVFSVSGNWDFSEHGEIAVEFAEPEKVGGYATISIIAENADALLPDARANRSRGVFQVDATGSGKTNLIVRPIPPAMPEFQAVVSELDTVRANGLFCLIWPNVYWGFQGAGWGNAIRAWTLDPKRVVRVSVRVSGGSHPPSVSRIAIRGPKNEVADWPAFAKVPPERFFPFIDRFGQFKWRDWPGKVRSEKDLKDAIAAEDRDLAAHPGPKGRDKWGGWADGPRFEATGGFTVRKVDGKWWFVDPDGRLWWSHGPVRVSTSCGMTNWKGRERYFEFLPKDGDPFAAFYRTRDELLWPYYVKWGVTNTYDFTSANLCRKYGEGWFDKWADRVHRRLRSWGANTIANSSDIRAMRLSRTPYCDRFEIKSRPLKGTEKVIAWWPFRDPFDPSFRADIRRQMEAHRAEMEDPWCFGFFVDNELQWGDEEDLGRWTWESPDDQPAKVEFRRRLAAKYGTVPKTPSAADFREFSLTVVNAYFTGVRDEFKRVAPNKLYMGCRFSGADDFVIREAAKYVDVMSFNYYEKDVKGFSRLPEGVDKPIIIGEFHFGALDRGPFISGLIQLKDQAERGETYRRYLKSALEDPRFVGAHWHQYSDDVATGRFDGENFQIGWVDICDNPYPETIAAVRWIGDNMYRIRNESKVRLR